MRHIKSGTFVRTDGEERFTILGGTLENGVTYQKDQEPYALTIKAVGGSGSLIGCQKFVEFETPHGTPGEFEYICVPTRGVCMIIFEGEFFFPQ